MVLYIMYLLAFSSFYISVLFVYIYYQLNSLFIFMMLFLFNVQLRNQYDDDDDLGPMRLQQDFITLIRIV